MDFRKAKGGKKGEGKSSGSKRFSPGLDERIDASPETSFEPGHASGRPGQGPRSIQDTKAWQESSKGARRAWGNYKRMLATNFQRLSRADQEDLITRACMIVTIGSTLLVIGLFYAFVPVILRVLLLPLALIGAYWVGTKVVAPIMIGRYSDYLNREF